MACGGVHGSLAGDPARPPLAGLLPRHDGDHILQRGIPRKCSCRAGNRRLIGTAPPPHHGKRRGKKVLFVERVDAGEGAEADEHMVAHLRELGFTVTVADQSDPETRARGQDLVIISGTCSKWKLANRYADIATPLISLEGLMSDTMHFSGFER